jgi:hypothetical protein
MSHKYERSVLKNMTLDEAKNLQFRLLDEVTKEFKHNDFFQIGDIGLHPEYHRPTQLGADYSTFQASNC